jgi:Methyltransferase FkbM domain
MIKQLAKYVLRSTGKSIADVHEIKSYRNLPAAIQVFGALTSEIQAFTYPHIGKSRSQLGQDIFALAVKGSSSPGFFVEYGATNGIDLSNTYLLETKFGWKGILAEPARAYHYNLLRNRSCIIDTRCVYSESGLSLDFLETENNATSLTEYSTIADYAESGDAHAKARLENATKYKVDTISLMDLLDSNDAPSLIDFMSVDTEGSEADILEMFPFGTKYHIKSLCVEHNYVQQKRKRINQLLVRNGYRRVFTEFSRWDDWYLHVDLVEEKFRLSTLFT